MKKTILSIPLLIGLILAGAVMAADNDQSDLICKIDYDGGTDPVYIGYANPGSADTLRAWQIQKLTYDGNGNVTTVQFANGKNDYVHVWVDRASYTYK